MALIPLYSLVPGRVAEGGADLQTVKERLGHGSLVITEKYLHTLAETDDTALTALASIRQRHHTNRPS